VTIRRTLISITYRLYKEENKLLPVVIKDCSLNCPFRSSECPG
jgi:hypothetical protein